MDQEDEIEQSTQLFFKSQSQQINFQCSNEPCRVSTDVGSQQQQGLHAVGKRKEIVGLHDAHWCGVTLTISS
jgi:hypothetical protein